MGRRVLRLHRLKTVGRGFESRLNFGSVAQLVEQQSLLQRSHFPTQAQFCGDGEYFVYIVLGTPCFWFESKVPLQCTTIVQLVRAHV